MSKHSKWAKVKNYKGAADAKRAGVFTKLGRAITVAAKQGGGDPTMNFRLRMAIEKAKEASMPKDTIERAVARGAGTGEGATIEEALYEGFGPGGAALMIHVLTDNKNRSLMNVRNVMAKHGGNMGGQNSVAWMFARRGLLRVATEGDEDEIALRLIDLGAEDVVAEEGGFTVTVAPERLEATRAAIEAAGMKVEFAEAAEVANEPLAIESDEERAKLETLIELLDDDEDVDEVTTNAIL